MKKSILITCISLSLFACASTMQVNSVIGHFEGRPHWNGDPNTTLSLKQGGIFELYWNNTAYTGTWEKLDKNQVSLKFNEITDIVMLLSSGVILDKERIIYFPNRNKIKMNNIILKRVK